MNQPSGQLERFKAGRPFREEVTADRLNAPIAAIESLQRAFNGALPPADSNLVGRSVLVQITGTVDGEPGRYTGVAWLKSVEQEPTGGLTATDLGDVPTEDNCEVWNLAEVDADSQALAEGRITEGTVRRLRGDGKYVVTIDPGTTKATFWARITGHTQDGTNLRWTYSFVEVEKTLAGYGGWTDKSGGRAGTDEAYNSIEDQNAATGTFGNGVSSSNLVGTITVQPAPTGVRVRMEQVDFAGYTEYWFSYENAVDGSCP